MMRFRENPRDLFRIRKRVCEMSWKKKKENVTRAKWTKFIYCIDFNSTFIFIRDSYPTNFMIHFEILPS